jgi:uncharacterized repeat protein (TIGR01451 family)
MRKLWLLASVFTLFVVGVTAGPTWAVDNETVPPLLSITKAVSATAPCPLDVLTYTLVIGNLNSGRAHSTIVTDFVPANTTYVPGSTQVDGATVADLPNDISPLSGGLDIGNVDPFGFPLSARRITFQVQVNARVLAGTVIPNSASVIAQELSTPAVSNEVRSTVALCVNLVIAKTVDPTSAAPGAVVTHTIAVKNDPGNQSATNVIVTDTIPATPYLEYVAGSTSVNGDSVPDAEDGTSPVVAGLHLDSIAAGATTTVTLQFTVIGCPPAGETVTNTATASSDQTSTVSSSDVLTFLPDITPPTIEITTPVAGVSITPCDVSTGTATITDLCPGVDLASIVVRIGGVEVPVTIVSSTETVVTISFPFPNLEITPIGPLPAALTIAIDASDTLGNASPTILQTVDVDCSYACARQLVIDASSAGAFKCAGADRQLVILIDAAAKTSNSTDLRQRALQLALDCVTRLSRELNFAGNTVRGGRAIFNRDATSEARAQVIEDQLRCLLAKL